MKHVPVEDRGLKIEVSVPGLSVKADYASPHEVVAQQLAKDGNVDGARAILNDKPGLVSSVFRKGGGDK